MKYFVKMFILLISTGHLYGLVLTNRRPFQISYIIKNRGSEVCEGVLGVNESTTLDSVESQHLNIHINKAYRVLDLPFYVRRPHVEQLALIGLDIKSLGDGKIEVVLRQVPGCCSVSLESDIIIAEHS